MKIFKFKITKIITFFISLAIIILLIKQINLKDIYFELKNFNFLLLIILGALYTLINFFRALRFKILIKSQYLDLKSIFAVTNLHNMMNNLIPARLGEFSYLYLLKKYRNIMLSESLATLFLSRIFDIIVNCILFLIVISVPITASAMKMVPVNIKEVTITIITITILLFLFLIYYTKRIIRLINKKIELNKYKNLEKLINFFDNTHNALKSVNSIAIYIRLFFLTSLIFIGASLTNFIILYGFGIKLPFFMVIFASTITLLSSLLPFYSFGGFGVVDGAWAISLMLLGLEKQTAIITSFSLHIIQLFFVLLLGAISFLIIHKIAQKDKL